MSWTRHLDARAGRAARLHERWRRRAAGPPREPPPHPFPNPAASSGGITRFLPKRPGLPVGHATRVPDPGSDPAF